MMYKKSFWSYLNWILRVGIRFFLLFSLPITAWSAPVTKRVRVAILTDEAQVTIKIRGRYVIIDANRQVEIRGGRRLLPTTFKVAGGGIRMDDWTVPTTRLKFIPVVDASIITDGKERRYRGELDLIKTADNKLLVVNTLGLEDYIKGVLYHEISPRWPIDAIMAQAVAVRSYAVCQIARNPAKEFDLYNDIYSQVYGGRTSEHYRTNLAVEQTTGEILTFRGSVLPAYFHATCAGHTEDVKELWKRDQMMPLAGVRCNFCANSPHRYWRKTMSIKDIEKALNAKGYKVDSIDQVAVVDTNESGRINNVQIITKSGAELVISGKDFRQAVGPNEIRSNKYRLVVKGSSCSFIGEGWGHGVGLCQWGAMGMARQRYNYRAILAHYYPGSELINIVNFHPVPTPPAMATESR